MGYNQGHSILELYQIFLQIWFVTSKKELAINDTRKAFDDFKNSTKTALFFLSRAPNHHNFTFNSQFLYKLKHMVHHFKTVRVIFHFRFRLLFIKFYIFVQQKAWTLWLPKVVIPFKIKIIEKPHTVLVPDHWFLSCNKNIQWYLHEFGKFNDICVSWSSPKTDL